MTPGTSSPPPTGAGAPAGATGGFRLVETVAIDPDAAPTRPLAELAAYWSALAIDGLPSLADADPDRLQVIPGRIHLVRVEADGVFRFLHYGAAVTNPDMRDMRGLTTRDYADKAFGALVTAQYAEGVAARRPVCRAVRAEVDGATYDYARLVAPFGLDGDDVTFLVIATQRIAIPERLDRAGETPDPRSLVETVERTRRLSRQVSGTDTGIALAGLAAAAAIHFSEATRLAARR